MFVQFLSCMMCSVTVIYCNISKYQYSCSVSANIEQETSTSKFTCGPDLRWLKRLAGTHVLQTEAFDSPSSLAIINLLTLLVYVAPPKERNKNTLHKCKEDYLCCCDILKYWVKLHLYFISPLPRTAHFFVVSSLPTLTLF